MNNQSLVADLGIPFMFGFAIWLVVLLMARKESRQQRERFEASESRWRLHDMQTAWTCGFHRKDEESEEDYVKRWEEHKSAVIDHCKSRYS